jgi:hypothetical protein
MKTANAIVGLNVKINEIQKDKQGAQSINL